MRKFPPNRTHLSIRPISTHHQDTERKRVIINRTTYRVNAPNRVLALCAIFLFTLFTPLALAQARAFSYLSDTKSDNPGVIAMKQEPQNSQNIAFLESANNFDPRKARGGGDITVVDDSALVSDIGPSGTIADIDTIENQGKVTLYVVRRGDTVGQVAKMFDVTVNTILWANDLPRGSSLRDGQHLVILPIDGVQHTIKKGDSLQSIAKKYSGDMDEILLFNDMTEGQKLTIGEIVIIPNGKEVAVTSNNNKNTSSGRSKVISSYPSYSGYYAHPVPSGQKSQGIHGYNGVDYSAPRGTPVYAAAEGIVIVSKFRSSGCGRSCGGGYGNYIVVEHPNGTQTLYGHLSAVYTSVAGQVEKGQQIGEVGNTGKSTGAHLHFEVRGARNPF